MIFAALTLFAQAVSPEDPASAVHPRKFGLPGGIGETRGWYFWRAFDPEKWTAEIEREQGGERFTVRVLPWLTSYRRLAYPGHPDELLPGERVNLFLNPEGPVKRAYLVHVQDEIGQMKGHGHFWEVETVDTGGRGFRARAKAGEKPLDPEAVAFLIDPGAELRRGGTTVDDPKLAPGDRLFLTWCRDGERRRVRLLADAESLDGLRDEAAKRSRERAAVEGMGAFVEPGPKLLIFSTHWGQAGGITPGRPLRVRATDAAYRATGDAVEAKVVAAKNLGAYGSGATEVVVDGRLDRFAGGRVVRVFESP